MDEASVPGIVGKSGLGKHNESGARLIDFCQENHMVIANSYMFSTTETTTIHMDNIEIKSVIYSAIDDGEVQQPQSKHDQELTLALITNSC